MKKTTWIAVATLASAILLGSGFLVGRQFPAHHFEHLGNRPYLYDSSTGHVCSVFPAGVIDVNDPNPLAGINFGSSPNKPNVQWVGHLAPNSIAFCNSK